MVGFVNALAILIFMDQVPERTDAPWSVHPPIIGGLARMVLFPKITTVIQAPLVSIAIRTVITIGAAIVVPTVGDKGDLPSPCRCLPGLPVPGLAVPGLPVPGLPVPGLPDVPFTLDTLTTIAPYAFAMALVGLMEALMTGCAGSGTCSTPRRPERRGRAHPCVSSPPGRGPCRQGRPGSARRRVRPPRRFRRR